jgi:hypothetical protein
MFPVRGSRVTEEERYRFMMGDCGNVVVILLRGDRRRQGPPKLWDLAGKNVVKRIATFYNKAGDSLYSICTVVKFQPSPEQ